MKRMIAELIEQRFGLPSTAGHDTPAEGELTAILNHRTHRRYTDMPISEDLMQQVLAAGLSAPAKSDLQQVAVLRVENLGIRRAVAELLPAMPWVAQAARFLVVCGGSRRIRRVCELRGIPFANDHLDAFLNAASDAAMVLQNLIRAASAAGLGACPISVIRNHATHIAELLALPDHVFPLAGLCLGWPSREGFVSLRLPMALTVHVTATTIPTSRPRSMATTAAAMAATTFPRATGARSSVSASHRSMAGRRTRPGRSRCPNGRILAPSFAARVSSWTSE